MPLVQAKCTNCGANLEVESTKDAAICPYCGSAYIVEKAVNNYNVTNHITANTVNIYGGNSTNFVIRGGVLEKYTGASTSVTIPNSVIIIGKAAFQGCRGLREVVIPSSVEEIESDAFSGCDHLTDMQLSEGLVKIGDSAFANCSSLKSINLPASLDSIGCDAFNKSGLTKISSNDPDKFITVYMHDNSKLGYIRDYVRLFSDICNIDEMKVIAIADTPLEKEVIEKHLEYKKEESLREEEEKQREKQEAQRKEWIRKGLCPKCGSPLIGFLKKYCTNRYCDYHE